MGGSGKCRSGLGGALMRHVFDPHIIRAHYDGAEVAALAREVMLADAGSCGRQPPAYGADPRSETPRMTGGVETQCAIRERLHCIAGGPSIQGKV
jgi:hypothetical protein